MFSFYPFQLDLLLHIQHMLQSLRWMGPAMVHIMESPLSRYPFSSLLLKSAWFDSTQPKSNYLMVPNLQRLWMESSWQHRSATLRGEFTCTHWKFKMRKNWFERKAFFPWNWKMKLLFIACSPFNWVHSVCTGNMYVPDKSLFASRNFWEIFKTQLIEYKYF